MATTQNQNIITLRNLLANLKKYETLFRAATATTLALGKPVSPKIMVEQGDGSEKEEVLKSATVFLAATQAGDLCISAGKLPKELNTDAFLRVIMACQVAVMEYDLTAAVPKSEKALEKATERVVTAKAQREAIPQVFASRRGK